MNFTNLGKKIKKYRQRARKTQMQLELDVELSYGVVSRIENGITNPDKETILRIAQALNLSGIETASLFGIEILLSPSIAVDPKLSLKSQDY